MKKNVATIELPLETNGICRICKHNTITIIANTVDDINSLIQEGVVEGREPVCQPCWGEIAPQYKQYFICNEIEKGGF